MLKKIRNSYSAKIVAIVLAVQLFASSIGFNNVYAGDGGPKTPESQSFEPVGTNQMVDLFTGDFTYNIPLFNIPGPDGGYPINLAYHSGVSMEQEAAWVGLGWNINVGAINRQVRNLPDDFGGDPTQKEISIKTDMRPNWTVGAGYKPKYEKFGFESGTNVIGNLGLYYNNYKGIGYHIDMSFAKGARIPMGSLKIAGDLSLNLSLDSQEGISSTYSLGLHQKGAGQDISTGVSTGFNSRSGWQRDIAINASMKPATKSWARGNRLNDLASASATLSFARASSMQIPNAMRGGTATLSLAKGKNTIGLFTAKKSGDIYFNWSTLKNKNTSVSYSGVGYMYYQNSPDASYDLESDNRVKDISRENDGLVHKNSRRLATPTMTYDVYSVTGQGIGNMFRPFRGEIATVVAPRLKSEFHGGSLGLEKGTPAPLNRFGIDVGYTYSHNKQDFWDGNSSVLNFPFQSTNLSLSSGVYFQNYGEQTIDDIGYNYGSSVASTKPVAYGLVNNDEFFDITNKDQNDGGSTISITSTRQERKRRAKDIEAFTNKMMMNISGSSTILSEFKLDYYPTPSSTGYNKASRTSYDAIRSGLPKTQVGGYTAVNETGMRYIYALPAMSNTEKDVVFSVSETPSDLTNPLKDLSLSGGAIDYKKKGTDQYYNSVEKSAYAHAYMMTSILGEDYADIDGVSGPSDGDVGYWVKFDYTRSSSAYKWRAPYDKSMYNKGYETSFKDGKGQYSYGTKEVWYMATAETKTHIAEFILSPRKDAKEVKGELGSADAGTSTATYMKLDRIDVYAKSERYPNGVFNVNAKPIQSCNFVYDYSLCTGIPDNDGSTTGIPNAHELANQDGKLTLKSFYFTYRNNQTGKSRPYKFEYNQNVLVNGVSQTPTYDRAAVDRWGNYQPNTNASNIDYPYNDPYTTKADMDSRAGLWNMSAINLPSGGRYEVDYESDSYAYVQNQVAMQMYKITSLDPYSSTITGNINHPKVTGTDYPEKRNIYFKLEQPIPTTLSDATVQSKLDKYMLKNEYLYFKVKINVNKNTSTTEYVSGYAKVSDVKVDLTSASGGNYQWGYVQLDRMKVNGKTSDFHPFTEVGARHIKYNQADLLYDNPPSADKDKLSKSDVKNMGWSLISNVTDIKDMFMNFTNMMYTSGRCTDIDLANAFIRLRTPDKIKYGGGHRVKEVRIIDNWASSFLSGGEASSTYGTVYDYNITDANGVTSSGVAAYEPSVGGDENPLRNPVAGWEDKNVASKTSAQTYSEDPGNESLFPGPTVGYSQVRVMSRVTAEKMANSSSTTVNYAGITVHKFCTAKDYPVIYDQSELQANKTFIKKRLMIPALVVNIDRTKMAASQGYYIELNDMHGKPSSETEIGFDDQGKEQIISTVEYSYFDDETTTTNRAGEVIPIKRLKNQVDVLFSDVSSTDPTKSDIRSSTLATEVEFIPETRYVEDKHISGALQTNFEYGSLPVPFFPGVIPVFMFYPIPSFNWKVEKTGTVVTNKIVNKTGIMQSTTATQRGSTVKTENLVFDDMTGQPLLTSVTNDYGDKVYNYSILATEQYEGTRGSYQNIGFNAIGSSLTALSNGIQHISLANAADGNTFYPGDVLIAVPVTALFADDASRAKLTCVFSRKNATNDFSIETKTALSGLYRFTIMRSGRRNVLNTPISSITALSKPTEGRILSPCTDARGGRAEQTYNKLLLNNVLSINAVELGNSWYKDTRQMQTVPSTWYDDAYFLRGFGGYYSAIRPYAYVDDRVQSSNVTLKTDGVMNNVELFDWNHLLSDCPTKWKMTEQVTLKNASSSDVESKNIIGTYSAKLYGSSGTQPIAVAGNAKNSEIGFENFEEYVQTTQPITANGTTNLNFYSSDVAGRVIEDRFDVTGGVGTNVVNPIVDIPASAVSGTTLAGYTMYHLRMHFDAKGSVPSKEILLQISPSFSVDVNGKVRMTFSDASLSAYQDSKWRGELFAQKTIFQKTTTGNAAVSVQGKGHTGSQCLGIPGSGSISTNPEFLQGRLTLKPGENYQFSGWYSTPNNLFLMQTYDRLFEQDFVIKFYKVDGTASATPSVQFSEASILQGGFIEDWQKFTLNFTMPADAHYMSIVMPRSNEVWSDELGDYTQIAYYDDLRIQPLDGAMKTYVYNQQNQRLEAVLDANNYATFYYYDDEGNLFLVKQETEKGIITQQESRSFNKKTE